MVGSLSGPISQRPAASKAMRLRSRLTKKGCQPRPAGAGSGDWLVSASVNSSVLPRKRSVPTMECKKCSKEFQQPVPNEKPLPEPAPAMGPLDSPRFEKGRNFANKVWNASRFVMTSIDAVAVPPLPLGERGELQFRAEDKWILSRLNTTIQAQTQALNAFELSKATNALYDFFWNEFCAWYIELAKPRMAPGADAADSRAASAVLLHVLDRSLRLLHPFCPFVSEALWTELNKRAKPADRHLGAEYNAASIRQNEDMLAVAARDFAPHDITFYLRELAASYHSYYDAERILVDQEPVKLARLALVAACAQLLHNGLAILGVSAPRKM